MNNKRKELEFIAISLLFVVMVGMAVYCGYSYSSNKWEVKLAQAEAAFASKKLDIACKQTYSKDSRNKQKEASIEKKDIDCISYLSQPIPSDCLLYGGRWITSGKR